MREYGLVHLQYLPLLLQLLWQLIESVCDLPTASEAKHAPRTRQLRVQASINITDSPGLWIQNIRHCQQRKQGQAARRVFT